MRFVSKKEFSLFLGAAALSTGLLTSTFALAGDDPIIIPAPVEKIFVPLGFDSNDDVEVILHGHFRNSCQKVGKASAIVKDGVVEVTAFAYQYEGQACADMMTSFIQSVKIGTLSPREYNVKFTNDPKVKAVTLEVVQTLRSEPDDFLYAPISGTDLSLNSKGEYEVTVEGMYPLMFIGCMMITDVKAFRTPGNVVVVQPIAQINRDGECTGQRKSRFKMTKKVDFKVEQGEFLIHARSLEGNSFNRLVEIND